jgi:hypothetical protein
MKRLFLLLALTPFLFSCEINSQGSEMETVNLTVQPSEWILEPSTGGLTPFYFCTFDMPEINTLVFNQGSVQVNYDMGNYQQLLPYVRQNRTLNFLWTQVIDFDYSVGSLTIYVTNSDFSIPTPPAMNFRVVIMH